MSPKVSLDEIHLLLSHVSDISSVLNVEEESEWISRYLPDQELYYLMQTYSSNIDRLKYLFININTNLYEKMRNYFVDKQNNYQQIASLFTSLSTQDYQDYEEMKREILEMENKMKKLESELTELKDKQFPESNFSNLVIPESISGSLKVVRNLKGKHNYSFKIMFIGQSNVGRSCLIKQFIDHKFDSSISDGLVPFCHEVTVSHKGKYSQLRIVNGVGYVGPSRINSLYARGVDAFVLTFDITDMSSLRGLPEVLMNMNGDEQKTKYCLLVGLKSDLASERQVRTVDAQNYAASLGVLYIEASAKMNHNVNFIFLYVVAKLMKDM